MNGIIPKKPKSAFPLIVRILRDPAVQFMLYPLEKITRSSVMVADGTEVVKADKLTAALLKDFFENKILAIHIPAYFSPEIAARTSHNILQKQLHNWNIRDVKTGFKESDVDVFGNPFTTASRDDASWINYFSGALDLAGELRALSYSDLYPLDKFRLEMDEIWPQGLMTGTYQGAKMVPGLVRVMHDKATKISSDTSLGCHVDDTPMLSPNGGKFSVNIYLKPAAEGGNLFVWNTKISGLRETISKWHMVKNFFLESNYLNEEVQKKFQSMLPKPREIKIKQGDLVLINTGRPHAVSGYSGGPRVSIQAFITYKKGKPLQIWA
jgi:hypothetical protein